MSVEREIQHAVDIGWFMPSIPMEQFCELFNSELAKRKEAERIQSEINRQWRELTKLINHGQKPDKIIMVLFSKVNWVEVTGYCLINGCVVDYTFPEFSMEQFGRRDACMMPNPNVPPVSFLSSMPFGDCRYKQQMQWSDTSLWAKNGNQYSDVEREFARSNFFRLSTYGYFSKDVAAFDAFHNSCHLTWINDPGSASDDFCSIYKKKEAERIAEEKLKRAELVYAEIHTRREEIRKSRVRKSKLNFVRRKVLHIKPNEMLGSQSILKSLCK